MKYYGINYMGHDCGVAVFDEYGNLEFYSESERYKDRTKNCTNLNPILDIIPKIEKTDIVCTPFYQKQKMKICDYDKRAVRKGDFEISLGEKRRIVDFVVDHHLCHCLSSWCFRSNNDERLFLSYDGFGSNTDGILKSYLVGLISENNFSIIDESFPIFSSACICDLIGRNSAGKLMGLVGYNNNFSRIEWNDKNLVRLIDSIYCLFSIESSWKNKIDFTKDEELLNYVCSFYNFVTKQIWLDLKKNIDCFSSGKGVVLGGGSALALEVNSLVFDYVKDVVFGPPINDSGLALGAAAFAYWHVNKKWPVVSSPSLNFLQTKLPKFGPQGPKEIAKALASNRVVGLLRGRAEAGPRALGFRSIFASAQDKNNLTLVSRKLKEREFYRPLAPIVSEESFDRYFIGPKGRYMQYKVICKEEAKKELPAIVHFDNSARPQVVSSKSDPWLHDLLIEYEKLTGHACFINTSLNGKGKPICNTLDDAMFDFHGKDMVFASQSGFMDKILM